jgi:hypothetical protein
MAQTAQKVMATQHVVIEVKPGGVRHFATAAQQQQFLREMPCPWLKNPGTRTIEGRTLRQQNGA